MKCVKIQWPIGSPYQAASAFCADNEAVAPVRRGSFKLGAARSSVELIVSSPAVRGAYCQLSGLGHRKLERRGHTLSVKGERLREEHCSLGAL